MAMQQARSHRLLFRFLLISLLILTAPHAALTAATVSFMVTSTPLLPAETSTGTYGRPGFVVFLTTDAASAHRMYFSIGGTATNGQDYVYWDDATSTYKPFTSPWVFSKTSGFCTDYVSIYPINDILAEPQETVLLAVTPHASYVIGNPSTAGIVIDNYSPPNQAPTIAQAAVMSPNPPTTPRATLTTLGADDAGEANLTYTWALTAGDETLVELSGHNGLNASKTMPVEFANSGTFTFVVAVTDLQGASASSSVTITIPSRSAPTLVNPINIAENPVWGNSTGLSVLGADNGGEAQLTYNWQLEAGDARAVTFSLNNSNSAKNTAITIPQPGYYRVWCIIEDRWGDAVLASATLTRLATLHSINFQPTGAPMALGYLPDYGDLYGARNGKSYGWNTTHTDVTRDRGINTDQRYDTLCHFHASGKWEILVPNGTYKVRVALGDPQNSST